MPSIGQSAGLFHVPCVAAVGSLLACPAAVGVGVLCWLVSPMELQCFSAMCALVSRLCVVGCRGSYSALTTVWERLWPRCWSTCSCITRSAAHALSYYR